MSNLQIIVLSVTIVALILIVWDTFVYRPPMINVHVETHDRSICPVCWRDYRNPTVLRYHLEGRDGEGQHGRIEMLKPLENDGEDCVRKELQ